MDNINLGGIQQDLQIAYQYHNPKRKKIWGRETSLAFDLLETTLVESLQIPEAGQYCKVAWDLKGRNIVICNLSDDVLGKLGTITLTPRPNYTEIEYSMEPGLAGEHYIELLKGWLVTLEEVKQRVEAQQDITQNLTAESAYPNMSHLLSHTNEKFKKGWLGLSDEDKESWEKMVSLIKEGDRQHQIANKLMVSQSTISKRLSSKDRLSLSMTMPDVRRLLS